MAVYTELTDADVSALLADYDIGKALTLKGIAEGVENSNYLLQTESGRFILTLYEKRVQADDLPFFLELQNHLAGHGLACPSVIARRDNTLISQAGGKPAAIISFLDGISLRRPKPAHCHALGQAMAEMHLAGQDFPMRRDNDLSLAGWQDLYDRCAARADEVYPQLADNINRELARVHADFPSGLPQGIIHADLFTDNVFFLGDKLSGIIDFYFACNDMLAYDIAIVLNDWCFEADVNFNITKARALFAGYQSVRPLQQAETEALPILASGAALRFLLTRLYDRLHGVEGVMLRPKDPMDYLRRLRFHKTIKNAADYGIGL